MASQWTWFVQEDSSCTKAAKCPTSVNKCAAQLLGSLFATVWMHGKHGQMRSNEEKCKGLMLMQRGQEKETMAGFNLYVYPTTTGA